MSKCIGCGVLLQNIYPDKEGYTKDLNNKFCERCFNIKHYNKYVKVKDKDYIKLIKEIDSKGDLILLVSDFLNLYNLDEIKLDSPVILVMTKADILPRSINRDTLLDKIKSHLNITSKVMVSSKNNFNFDLLYSEILKYKKSNNVYVIGYTNAGKSTLVNKMLKNYGDKAGEITTSNLPSTTLDLISNKVNSNLTLIDTPGLLDEGSLILTASNDLLKKITPKKEIRPISYQIKGRQYLIIEDFMRLGLENTNVIIYMSNEIECNRAYKEKNYSLKRYDFKMLANQDLVIKGLGFISFKKDSMVTLWLLDECKYLIRDSII